LRLRRTEAVPEQVPVQLLVAARLRVAIAGRDRDARARAVERWAMVPEAAGHRQRATVFPRVTDYSGVAAGSSGRF